MIDRISHFSPFVLSSKQRPDTAKQLFGLVQFTVKWFFIAVIVYSLFDLAANSKLVAAPNVHMAETSDKTFDDVVGVDEVRMKRNFVSLRAQGDGKTSKRHVLLYCTVLRK